MKAEIKTYIQSRCPKGVRLIRDTHLIVDASKKLMKDGVMTPVRLSKTVALNLEATDTDGKAKEKFEVALAEAIQTKHQLHRQLATNGFASSHRATALGTGKLQEVFEAMFQLKWGNNPDKKQAEMNLGYFKDVVEFFKPDFKLNLFTLEMIEEFKSWVAMKIAERPANGSGSVANGSINKRLGVIREILRYAIKKRLLKPDEVPNPDPRVKNMGIVDLPRGESKQKPAFTIEEQETFIRKIRDCGDDWFADVITVAFDFGMRHEGELFGFKVDDINFGRKTITWYRPKIGIYSEETPINERCLAIFKKYREVAMTKVDRKMFSFSKGKMRCKWDKFIRLCGYNNRFTPYCTRHTYVTRLADSGVNPKVCQKLAGHKAIETTLKYYTHTSSKLLTDAMSKLQNQVQEYEAKIKSEAEKAEDNLKLASLIGHNSKKMKVE
jgi:integrase